MNFRSDSCASLWLSELMGRIQAVMINADTTSEKIEYFCDVFIVVVITLANNDLMLHNGDAIVISRELRMSLLPQSMALLLSHDLWSPIAGEVSN